jgi:hypothetical protein
LIPALCRLHHQRPSLAHGGEIGFYPFDQPSGDQTWRRPKRHCSALLPTRAVDRMANNTLCHDNRCNAEGLSIRRRRWKRRSARNAPARMAAFGKVTSGSQMTVMGAILPVKRHGERLLSGMAPKPPDDRRVSTPAIGWWPSSNVANGWIAEPSSLSPASSLDHGVGSGEGRRRDREAERLCDPQIDDELKCFGLFDWEIRRLGTVEYPPDIDAAFAISA